MDSTVFFQNNDNGILITKSGSLTVSDISITNNVSHQDGAFVGIFHSTGSQITNNQTVDSVRQGIAVANENTGLLVQGNSIQGGGRGIFSTTAFVPTAPGSSQVTISDNTISGTSGDGVSLDTNSLTGSTISDNSVTGAGRDGVFIAEAAAANPARASTPSPSPEAATAPPTLPPTPPPSKAANTARSPPTTSNHTQTAQPPPAPLTHRTTPRVVAGSSPPRPDPAITHPHVQEA
ncbi:right-handed parallel beta-helix repeat-containing protein [Streptomyces sp. NPDC051018]|uniref:right-handed parallel beta-helix repeat-containing protein n=1 Tax=Streptomyces sp. NPDC051018 TaxID=3365639 RepID=UPI0037A9551D